MAVLPCERLERLDVVSGAVSRAWAWEMASVNTFKSAR
jgi:hypothetical protein